MTELAKGAIAEFSEGGIANLAKAVIVDQSEGAVTE